MTRRKSDSPQKAAMRTSYEDMDIAIPRDRKGEYEPQLIPKYQNTVTRTWKKRSYLCMQMDAIHYHVRSEGFNRQLRKVTKSRTVFPSGDSLLKMSIWLPWTSLKNGPDAAGTGPIYGSHLRSILKNGRKSRILGNLFDMSIYTQST